MRRLQLGWGGWNAKAATRGGVDGMRRLQLGWGGWNAKAATRVGWMECEGCN